MKRALALILGACACAPRPVTLLELPPDAGAGTDAVEPRPERDAQPDAEPELEPDAAFDAGVEPPVNPDAAVPIDAGTCSAAIALPLIIGGYHTTTPLAGNDWMTAPHITPTQPGCGEMWFVHDQTPRSYTECGEAHESGNWPGLAPAVDWAVPQWTVVVGAPDRSSLRWFADSAPGTMQISVAPPRRFANAILWDEGIIALSHGPGAWLQLHYVAGDPDRRELGDIQSVSSVGDAETDHRDPRLFSDALLPNPGGSRDLWISYGEGGDLIALRVNPGNGAVLETRRVAVCSQIDHQVAELAGQHLWAVVRCGSDVYWIDQSISGPPSISLLSCAAAPIAPALAVSGGEAVIAFWNQGEPTPAARHYDATSGLSGAETHFEIDHREPVIPGGVGVVFGPTSWLISFSLREGSTVETWTF